MQNLLIVVLAALGILWKIDGGARVYVDWAVLSMFAAVMFVMGARFDAALSRWENQPHWRKTKTGKTLRLS
jgi:hypothetical protein